MYILLFVLYIYIKYLYIYIYTYTSRGFERIDGMISPDTRTLRNYKLIKTFYGSKLLDRVGRAQKRFEFSQSFNKTKSSWGNTTRG